MTFSKTVQNYIASLPADNREDMENLFAVYIQYADDEEAARKNLDELISSGRIDYELDSGAFDEEVQKSWDKNYARGVVVGEDGIFIPWGQCARIINLNDCDQARAFRHIFHEQEDKGCTGDVIREIDRYIDETFPNGYRDDGDD